MVGFGRAELATCLAHERAQEQAAAHSDAAVDAPDGERNARRLERFLPRDDVLVDAVEQRPVQVEKHRRAVRVDVCRGLAGPGRGPHSLTVDSLHVTPSIRLGRLFGIEIGANWSLVFIFALVSVLFSWLTCVNLALGLFNLVPAFPLDGGRLLSSLLWWRSGNRQRGVHNAVRVGRVFAYLMIAAGVLELFFGQVANGLWIPFIGWFLLSAAASEEAGSNIRALLRSVPVSAAMRSPVVTLPDWVTVEQFLESVAPNHSFTTYPIHEPSGKLTGVVRLSDLVRLPAADRATKHLIDVARR